MSKPRADKETPVPVQVTADAKGPATAVAPRPASAARSRGQSTSTKRGRGKVLVLVQKASSDAVGGARDSVAAHITDLDRPGYFRLQDVLEIYPVSRASWYAGIANGIYPKSVALGPRSVGWRTSDIKALIENPPTAKATAANKPHKRGGPDT